MPKLLQINVCLDFSTGKIAQAIGDLAIANDWESWIAYGRSANSSQLNIIKVGNMFSVYEHFAENRVLDREGLASRIPTRRLVKKIKEIKPDVVHLHNIHDHWLNYPMLFECLRELNMPVVWTFHDCWAFTGHCYHFDSIGCDRWKTQCYDCPQRNRFGLERSRRNYDLKKKLFAGNKNLTIVPVSYWMEGLARESFLKDKRIQTIQNGIDLNVFQPHEVDLRKRFGLERKFVILGVATAWTNSKGLKDYIKLAEVLADEYQIVLVGLKPEQIAKMSKNIICVEKTSSQLELVGYYTMADVLTSLSYGESFGLTIAEAIACGTPAIVYNNTAQPELVDEKTGRVVETGNIAGVVNAIKEIRENGKSFYIENCIARAQGKFDKNLLFCNYITLYSSLLGGGANS